MSAPRTLALIAALAPFLLTAAPAPAQVWERQSPLPADTYLQSVAFPTPSHGFICGRDMLLLETTDGGQTWAQAPGVARNPLFQNDPLNEIFFLDEQHGWVIGNNDQAFRTTDGGQSWQQMTGFPAGSYTSLVFVSPTDGWAGGNGSVVRTRDGGLSWDVLTYYNEHGLVAGLAFRDSQIGFFTNIPLSGSTFAQGIYKTTDGGDTWTLVHSGPTGRMLFLDANTILAASVAGFLISGDLGQTWSVVAPPLPDSFADWVRLDANTVMTVGAQATVHITTDRGATWTQLHAGHGMLGGRWGIDFGDALNGWIVGPTGWLLRTRDGGATWEQANNGLAVDSWTDIQMLDTQFGFAVGRQGQMAGTTDGGRTWAADVLRINGSTFGRFEDIKSISVLDRFHAVAGGTFSSIYVTADGGGSWDSVGYPAVPEAWIHKVVMVDPDTIWAVGQNSLTFNQFLYRSVDGGQTWQNRGFNGGVIYGADFFDAQTGWVAGAGPFALKTVDGGASWILRNLPSSSSPITEIAFARDDPNCGWALAAFGYVARTQDDGLTWSLQTLPNLTGNEGPAGIAVIDSQRAWIATGSHEHVYHTTDGGSSWVEVPTGINTYPGVGTAGISAPNDDSVWICGAGGTILASNPPAGPDFSLDPLLLQAGAPASFTARGALPGERVFFLYSLAGAGSGPCPGKLGGLCLDLLPPVRVLGDANAGAAGVASVTVPIPANAAGVSVDAQAVIRRGQGGAGSVKSNSRSAVVQ